MFVHEQPSQHGLGSNIGVTLPGGENVHLAVMRVSDPASHRRPSGGGGNPEHAEHECPESLLEPPHGGVVIVRWARERTKGVGLGEEHVLMLQQ